MSARPSSQALVAANLLPLLAVLYFGWGALSLLLLYWAEAVAVGLVNVLRMSRARSDDLLAATLTVPLMHRTANLRYHHLPRVPDGAIKLFLVPFFVVHFGAFCLALLTAIVGLYTEAGLSRKLGVVLPEIWQPTIWWFLLPIVASHLYSLHRDFIAGGEYRISGAMSLMQRPYGRLLGSFAVVLAGAAVVIWFGSPMQLLVVLVAAKTIADLKLHERERRLLCRGRR